MVTAFIWLYQPLDSLLLLAVGAPIIAVAAPTSRPEACLELRPGWRGRGDEILAFVVFVGVVVVCVCWGWFSLVLCSSDMVSVLSAAQNITIKWDMMRCCMVSARVV